MLAMRYVLRSDFTCACDLAAPDGAGVLLVTLSASVGDAPAPRCPNRPTDVRAVQEALNRFAPADGGPPEPLALDGVCGALTRKAIRAFQRHWMLSGVAGGTERDGVIDVDGPTATRLREGPGAEVAVAAPRGERGAARPGRDDARLRAARPRVLEIVATARAVLSVAQARYKRFPLASDITNLARGDAAVAKVEAHFHAGRTRDPAARLARIDAVYQGMQATLALAAAGLTTDPTGCDDHDGALAAAWEGGLQAGAATGRMRAIRVFPPARDIDGEALAYALVHSLAHHVGPATAPIVDLAYCHRSPEAYAALGPAGALRNADSYAQFAFDAAGRVGFDPTRPHVTVEVAPRVDGWVAAERVGV